MFDIVECMIACTAWCQICMTEYPDNVAILFSGSGFEMVLENFSFDVLLFYYPLHINCCK